MVIVQVIGHHTFLALVINNGSAWEWLARASARRVVAVSSRLQPALLKTTTLRSTMKRTAGAKCDRGPRWRR